MQRSHGGRFWGPRVSREAEPTEDERGAYARLVALRPAPARVEIVGPLRPPGPMGSL